MTSPSQANAEQISFWNGTAGERWVAAQEAMDRTISPLGEAAMEAAAIAPGHRVLDIGCGCGDTTLALTRRVGPRGAVTGMDVSAPMLARARERAIAEGLPAEFVLGDASRAPLPEADRVYSRFGVMFFDDPVGAFTHLHRALLPDGRLAFVAWRSLAENPWAKVPLDAVNSVLGPADPPPPDAPGPFAFADADRIRAILGEAGFRNVDVRPLDLDLTWQDIVRIGPAARRLADAPDELRERAIDAILARVRPLLDERGLVLGSGVWVVTAER